MRFNSLMFLVSVLGKKVIPVVPPVKPLWEQWEEMNSKNAVSATVTDLNCSMVFVNYVNGFEEENIGVTVSNLTIDLIAV
jgi:hypothetical protein